MLAQELFGLWQRMMEDLSRFLGLLLLEVKPIEVPGDASGPLWLIDRHHWHRGGVVADLLVPKSRQIRRDRVIDCRILIIAVRTNDSPGLLS